MKLGRRQFLRGIAAVGAAAAVPAFVLRPERQAIEAGGVEFTGELSDVSPYIPRKGETWSNMPSRKPITAETFERVRAEMKRLQREPVRPTVLLVPAPKWAEFVRIVETV